MKPESRRSSEQGLASAVNLAAFDHEFIQTPLTKHASFVLALHLERLFDSAGFPTTKPRGRALQKLGKR